MVWVSRGHCVSFLQAEVSADLSETIAQVLQMRLGVSNWRSVISRTIFCCNKIVRNLHLFLTKVAVKIWRLCTSILNDSDLLTRFIYI